MRKDRLLQVGSNKLFEVMKHGRPGIGAVMPLKRREKTARRFLNFFPLAFGFKSVNKSYFGSHLMYRPLLVYRIESLYRRNCTILVRDEPLKVSS
ncbi:hypothetical protein MLD38_039582 [Melastoma candidum]|uniref:Uncharacterized protein n=1 Tax=Melastoma candidum TaxID=119954 RepID=A0ACB9L3Q5_9MYRT|nr:hypothetical protein MLD38_039582 [Melastoma candidum]